MKWGHTYSAFTAALAASSFVIPQGAKAMFAEDAGTIDFLIATPGHAVTRFVHPLQSEPAFITSDADGMADRTSCYISKRSATDGSVAWRRNACSGPSADQNHAVSADGDFVFTVDQSGILRAWAAADGALLWDADVGSAGSPRVWTFRDAGGNIFVAGAAGENIVIISAEGQTIGDITMETALDHVAQSTKDPNTAEWLHVIPAPNHIGAIRIIFGILSPNGVLVKKPILLEVDISAKAITLGQSRVLGNSKPNVVANSLTSLENDESWNIVARTDDSEEAIEFSIDSSEVSDVVATNVWSKLTADVYPIAEEKAEQLQAATYCKEMDAIVGLSDGAMKVWKTSGGDHPVDMTGDVYQPAPSDLPLTTISLLACETNTMRVLLTSESGTATAVALDVTDNGVKSAIEWTSEDGLATVSSAIMLDGSHMGSDDLVGEQAELLNRLSFSSRLASQIESVTSAVSARLTNAGRKDHAFGFVKVAALLSQSTHRVWGIDTAGSNKGTVKWMLDLPRAADRHVMVHGTKSSKSAVHGINGGTHSREILVLSLEPQQVSWNCIDGTNGESHASGSIAVPSSVVQISPIYGSSELCRQGALLLHDDMSVTTIPDDNQLKAHFAREIAELDNGFFAHVVDRDDNKVESVQIKATGDDSFASSPVGQTRFAGEQIVAVTYPLRDEIIQRMSTVLGDNSLLLKYINPHLVAIVTVTADDAAIATKEGDLASSISKPQASTKRKPAGVGSDSGTSAEVVNKPNLYVNLVDTVTGRIVHRTSHVNADPTAKVCITISENWVIYTFVNNKSRRTELGVLTLHEGMIDSKSLTAFSSPEQTTSFSSFSMKESKPVVLSKLYTWPKAVTALGSTATRDGISARQILFATTDGKITAIPRQMLETRRPNGELKPAEKTEGLVRYGELIPMVPLMALSYNNTVEGVRSVLCIHTGLESQSLMLAFGGPDIFYTRTSPTKGFDLLPESFSHVLVSIVTVGLLIVVVVVKKMSTNKTIKQGWT